MKGISEIVSAVVILGIGISLVSIYSQWAPTFAEDTVDDFSNQSNQRVKCSNAAFSIKDAEYDKSSNSTIFYLENDGTIRFARGITIGVFNSTTVEVGRATIQNLDVEQDKRISISTPKIPSSIIATSRDCPDIEATEERINVHR